MLGKINWRQRTSLHCLTFFFHFLYFMYSNMHYLSLRQKKNQQKQTTTDNLNDRTIKPYTVCNDDETDVPHFLFFSFFFSHDSSIIRIVAIWHHRPLQMDIKELRFKGIHQPLPVQPVEVKCRQFKIM